MKILLDTHHAFWFVTDRGQLTATEASLLRSPSIEPLISAVSIWEFQLKWHRLHRSGDRKGPVDPAELFSMIEQAQIPQIDLTPGQASARLVHDTAHSDPFDRLLLLQAQEIGAKLMTRDRALRGHPLVVQL